MPSTPITNVGLSLIVGFVIVMIYFGVYAIARPCIDTDDDGQAFFYYNIAVSVMLIISGIVYLTIK